MTLRRGGCGQDRLTSPSSSQVGMVPSPLPPREVSKGQSTISAASTGRHGLRDFERSSDA